MSSIDMPQRALSEFINIGQYSHVSVYGADGKQTARTFDAENRLTWSTGTAATPILRKHRAFSAPARNFKGKPPRQRTF